MSDPAKKTRKYLITVMSKVERVYEVTASDEAEARRLFVEDGPDTSEPVSETDHDSEIEDIALAE
jgi:hypothetical protein